MPTLQLGKKYYRAKLDQNASAERAERAKKRYELARGRTRARTQVAGNVESLWKAVILLLRSTSVSQLLRQKKREIETKGSETFSSEQVVIAVTEPKTVKVPNHRV